jgi:hypothetical protein
MADAREFGRAEPRQVTFSDVDDADQRKVLEQPGPEERVAGSPVAVHLPLCSITSSYTCRAQNSRIRPAFAAFTRTVRCPVRQARRMSFLKMFASTTTGGGRSRMSPGNEPWELGKRMVATALSLCMPVTASCKRRAKAPCEPNLFSIHTRLLRATLPGELVTRDRSLSVSAAQCVAAQ